MHPSLLLSLYIAVAGAPLALAWSMGLPPRPWLDELSSAIALVAYAMMLMEFVLSGRFRPVTGQLGIDRTMRFHQMAARPVLILVLIHPFIYTLPMGRNLPGGAEAMTLGLDGLSIVSGILAWIGLGALVVMAIRRDQLPYRYEAWRISHGLGAALIAGLGAHHAIEAGRYSGRAYLSEYWLVLLAVALSTLVVVYLLRPLRELRRPHRLTENRKIADRTWELTIEREGGAPVIDFRAGQFVWLTVGDSPFSLREHPFSIASAPSERERLRFIIKEMGDFTNTIGEIERGARAFVDGPYGRLTLPEDGDGIVFLAGGTGIAPILSMLRELRGRGDTRKTVLIYGNRAEDQICLREEIDAMGAEMDLKTVYVLGEPPQGWSGETGVVDEALIKKHASQPEGERWYYIVCGPPVMIDADEAALKDMGVPSERIISERFSFD